MTFPRGFLAHGFPGLAVSRTVADAVWSLGWQGCIVTGRSLCEATTRPVGETRWDVWQAGRAG